MELPRELLGAIFDSPRVPRNTSNAPVAVSWLALPATSTWYGSPAERWWLVAPTSVGFDHFDLKAVKHIRHKWFQEFFVEFVLEFVCVFCCIHAATMHWRIIRSLECMKFDSRVGDWFPTRKWNIKMSRLSRCHGDIAH